MFIAMNRFQVLKDGVDAFERIWLTRDSSLHELPGFITFHLLRGPEHEDHVLYASHTVWTSRGAFEDWTRSEQFRRAHAGSPGAQPLTLGHPRFEGFEVVQTVAPAGTEEAAA